METMFEPFDYTTMTYDMHVQMACDCIPSLLILRSSPAATALAGTVSEEHVEATRSSAVSPQQSAHNSPTGSPPLVPEKPPARSFVPDNISSINTPRPNQPVPGDMPSHVGTSTSFSRPLPPQRPKAPLRSSSKSSSGQVLDSENSWSTLAEQNLTLPADALEGVIARENKSGSSGMLGFLTRKKGRDRSPKPKDPGILGKYGARQILNPN
jgi:serine/threonine kinase 32